MGESTGADEVMDVEAFKRQKQVQNRRIEMFHELRAQREATPVGGNDEHTLLTMLLWVLAWLISTDLPTDESEKVEDIARSEL